MKQKNVKKLTLNKITIQDLQVTLNQDELKKVNGGSNTPGTTTEIAAYC
ncbi:MAG TPA: hypothetical protein VK469_12960 [Candidatus Kapabacteria bacterium]|nr:hypothetical protein [Candidatus Kapabacteria bacterium]